MTNAKDKLWRPPITEERKRMIQEIVDEMNKDSLFTLSKHDILNMCIDRAYIKMFPGKQAAKRKKKYIRIDF